MSRPRVVSVGDNIIFRDEKSGEEIKGQIIDYDCYKNPDVRLLTVVTEDGKEMEVWEGQII